MRIWAGGGLAELRSAGHDVETVADEGLSGEPDQRVFAACQAESRALITLDVEFGNPLLFDPSNCAGVAVIRVPRRATPGILDAAIAALTGALAKRSITGRLWIIQGPRVREYQPEAMEDL